MHYFSLLALFAALFFPAPTARLNTSDAGQVITLSPVEHVAAAPISRTQPRLAATPSVTRTSANTKSQTASVAAAPVPKAIAQAAPAPVAAVSQASVTTADASFSALKSDVIANINAARAAEGLSTLTADPALGAIARSHSADMLAHDYFEHTSLSGCTAVCRYQNAGYSYWSMGENIYWMEGFSLTESAAARQVVDAWQNSPGHRENDLGKFTRVGVGVAQSGSKVYVTADFATPR